MIEVILYDDFVINYKDLKSSSLAVQLSVDCHMKITVNKKTFYDDWICPIELYFQYCEWRNKCKKMHNYCDFNYITEDNSENPILKFQYISNNSWLIDSCYKEYNEAVLISTEQVNNFFEQYEIQILNHTIKEIC